MGLDISAYSKAARVLLGPDEQFTEEQQEELQEADDVIHVYSAEGFEERLDGLTPGFYRFQGEAMGFRAGSYSGYNWWRRHLSLMALEEEPEDVWGAPDQYTGAPFFELINFSDCSGFIGPRTSKKLAEDFRSHADRAEAYARAHAGGNRNRGNEDSADVVHPWWLENYQEWRKAFELASDDGFVHFH